MSESSTSWKAVATLAKAVMSRKLKVEGIKEGRGSESSLGSRYGVCQSSPFAVDWYLNTVSAVGNLLPYELRLSAVQEGGASGVLFRLIPLMDVCDTLALSGTWVKFFFLYIS